MARVRQLFFTLASGALLQPGMAAAIGLGEITLHSALNQPLRADIQVVAPGDLSSHEVTVRLASPDAYARAGVERFMGLDDLRFTPELHGSGSVIRVASTKPVREPYLNFIVELVRPGGSLLREYTLLIDPADPSEYRLAPASRSAVPAFEPARPVARAAAPTTPPLAEQGKQYQVQRGDSLWLIARRFHVPGGAVSQDELMRGIQALNPDAFVGGESHRLIAGKTLRLPDAAGQPAAPMASTATSVASAPASPVAEQQTPPRTPAPDQALSLQQLNEAQQRLEAELNSQATEKLQLQQGVAQLQQQLDALTQELRSKDEQITALQAQLGQRDGLPQDVVTPQDAATAQVDASTAPQPERAPDADVSTPSDRAPQPEAMSPADAPPVAEQSPVTPPTAAPQPATASESEGFNLAWAGALLAVLLGGLLVLLGRRRRRAPPAPEPVVPHLEPSSVVAPSALPQMVVEPVPSPQSPPPRPLTASTDDLDGAELYIAYGRYGAALSILRKLTHRHPQRTDAQLRLLDVLGQLRDADGFARQLAVLSGLGIARELVEPIKARYPELLGGEPEPVAEVEEPVPAPVAEEPLLPDDFQLNLDDLTLDADWDLVSPFQAEKKAEADEQPVFDVDFSSNLDELPHVQELDGFGEPLVVEAAPLDELPDSEFLDVFDDPALEQAPRATDDLSHLAGDQDNVVKLNLALAYIEQGNIPSACGILNEVISEGNPEQQREARALLAKIA